MHVLGILLLLWIAGLSSATESDPLADKRQALHQLEGRLQELRQTLQQQQAERKQLLAELERYERNIAQLARGEHELRAMVQEQEQQLAEIQRALKEQQRLVARERDVLGSLLRSAYALGFRQSLRTLLNQSDAAQLSRTLAYYAYLNRYRSRRLRAFSAALQTLRAQQKTFAEETQRLARLAERQRETRKRLRQAQHARTQFLRMLEESISDHSVQLVSLQQDTEALRALLKKLEPQAAILPEVNIDRESLAKRRGQLPWPLPAVRILKRFGQRKAQSGQRWDGVLLGAREGTEVRAIHPGRVVYADWLRGFGLLLILEHEDGYMSLYGHNQTLFKETGEWVDAGELIALSGASGGQTYPGLYFALRHHGKPLNPARWCRAIRKPGKR